MLAREGAVGGTSTEGIILASLLSQLWRHGGLWSMGDMGDGWRVLYAGIMGHTCMGGDRA